MSKIKKQRIISVCIIGKPNAGKSSILNNIVGKKISIVTPKAQTTRSVITGILTIKNTQIILFDTPGIFQPKKQLEKSMVKYAWSSLNSADIVVLVIDSRVKIDKMIENIISRVNELEKKLVFILNKIDLRSTYYLDNLNYLTKNYPNSIRFNTSALTGQGINVFINFLKKNAQDGSWLYGKYDVSSLTTSFLASEITREQLFLNLQEELPYNLIVINENLKKNTDGSIKINQTILVPKKSYRNIIIGKKGEKIKEISTKARINIGELLQEKIHLFIFVKVKKYWEPEKLF